MPQLHIEAAQRRAAIAADQARGIETAPAVGFALRDDKPHQSLPARYQGALALQTILICEGDVGTGAQEYPADFLATDQFACEILGHHLGSLLRPRRPIEDLEQAVVDALEPH